MQKLETAVARGRGLLDRRKAITALFPYAIWRSKNGQGDMLDTFFRISRVMEEETLRQSSADTAPPERRGFMWDRAKPFVAGGVVVRSMRQLKDVKILKSYLLLLWSERWPLHPDGFSEMHASVPEDFSGIEMGHHRTDFIQMLDRFLEQLGREQGTPEQEMKGQYCSLKKALVEAENKASDTLTWYAFQNNFLFRYTHPGDTHRNPFAVHLRLSHNAFLIFMPPFVAWRFASRS